MRVFKIAFLCIAVLGASGINAAAPEIDSARARILRSADISGTDFSLSVYDLKNDKTVYSFNDEKMMSIASVTKLFITAASVSLLGQDFRFMTNVYSLGNDIYIEGNGDPLFVSETMWYLVNRLVDIGIKEIRGNIILDESAFATEVIYEDGNDRAYSAMVSPLSVNFNSIAVNIVSGSNSQVNLDPRVPVINLVDLTKKGKGRTGTGIRRKGNDIVVTGNINTSGYGLKTVYRNIAAPLKYFTEVLRLHLGWRGIKFSGSVTTGAVPAGATLLFEVESRRLADLLSDMNRFSNNFIAEQLLRAIALKTGGKPANTAIGLDAVRKYLLRMGFSGGDFNIVNASGFSRDNKTTARALVAFLKNMYFDFQAGPEFVNSLAISGMDGTIKKTIGDDKLKGKIRAKSGTMNGIRGLAGYANGKNSVYAFVILANHRNAYKLVDWEGRILAEVTECEQ
ncbi:MAG: D-alanyl-D-alanine carboxypeptidase/D-alanyl-D-alanine-endopeptidase [Oligoflexia bacterium]|nr:D-alanyl-D-alanine carboxypeptidase/D-alanyl-D-alanine-endopeptidase [Oligoflexia bacterium]